MSKFVDFVKKNKVIAISIIVVLLVLIVGGTTVFLNRRKDADGVTTSQAKSKITDEEATRQAELFIEAEKKLDDADLQAESSLLESALNNIAPEDLQDLTE